MIKFIDFLRNKISSYDFKSYNVLIMLIAVILGGLGAFELYLMPGISENLYLKQILGIGIGVIITFIVSMFDYRFISTFAVPLYVLNLVMLGMVKFTRFGVTIYGARRWLGFKDIFTFQPSELSKVIMIIVMATIYQKLESRIKKWWVILVVGVVFAAQLLLILLQPDLSTSIVFCMLFFVMLFSSGYDLRIIVGMILVGVPAGIFLFWYVQQPNPIIITATQQERILSFLHPELYPDVVYQQNNAVNAISSGGLLGKFLTGYTGTKGVAYVPVRESDFIFTGIAEDFGFIGSVLVIVLFLLLTFCIIRVAVNAKDLLGKLIAIGCATIFITQSFVNLGVVMMILPNTGIPLPFVSNGLSSTLSSYIMLGLVQNIAISRHQSPTKDFSEGW